MKNKLKVVAILLLISLAVCALCSCASAKKRGEFYTVKEAYEKGWLTEEELQNLADVYNNYFNSGFDRSSIGELDETISKKIKQTHANNLKENYECDNVDLDLIKIIRYYGKYGDCFAVYVRDEYIMIDLLTYDEYNVDGVKFYHFRFDVVLWQENKK